MKFNPINIENWERKDYYTHYMQQVRCTYSLTTNIDITGLRIALKDIGKKIYPVQIYMIATIVNQYKEFRMSFNAEGDLGYWDELNPSYTIFNKSKESFSSIWTMYNQIFEVFYDDCIKDVNTYSQSSCLMPKSNEPANSFTISSLPWVDFTGFNINVFSEGTYLLPIFTFGKFIEQNKKVLMPVSIQVHHAVCDGFHIGRFINSLQELSLSYNKWL